jgi:hypothetical protein
MKIQSLANLRRLVSGDTDQELEGQEADGTETDGEGGGDEGNADEGDGEGQEADDTEGADSPSASFVGQGSLATVNSVENVTDTSAAFNNGVTAERKRWAEVLTSAEAEGKFALAADMLAEDMSADAIKRILKGQAKSSNNSRLASTPRHNLGATPKGEGGEGEDRAAQSRKRAVQNVNTGRGGQKKKDA